MTIEVDFADLKIEVADWVGLVGLPVGTALDSVVVTDLTAAAVEADSSLEAALAD